jgi:hypothetical protein
MEMSGQQYFNIGLGGLQSHSRFFAEERNAIFIHSCSGKTFAWKIDIHVSVHHDTIDENDQQDATV